MADDKEKAAFDELKRRMKGDMENEMYEDDNLFYKFLIARDFKVDNAEHLLRQHLEWRKKYDVKNILNYKPKEVFEKYLILDIIGYDKEGCLVKYNHFANTDLRGIIESSNEEDWIKAYTCFFEQDLRLLKSQSKKLGKTVDKVVYIENLENFSLAKTTDRKVLSRLIPLIIMYMDNYPETFKASYAINAPVYFHIFFNVLKAFLPNKFLKKLHLYGCSDDSWKKDLLEVIDADVLPAFLGGKRTDPDGNPLCQTIIRNSETVPKSYYLRKNKKSFSSRPDFETITVSRGKVHEVFLEVKEPDSCLEWEFQLKSGDIKFGILYQDNNGKKTEVLPLQRINTDEYPQSGFYRCRNSGTYIAVFDNSYSLLTSKEIYCKITINNPHQMSSNQTYESHEEATN